MFRKILQTNRGIFGAFLGLSLLALAPASHAEDLVAVRLYGTPELARDPSGNCVQYTQMVLDKRAHTVTTEGPKLTETSRCRMMTNPRYASAQIESTTEECGSVHYTLATYVNVGADTQKVTFTLTDHSNRECENVIPSRFILRTADGRNLYGNR